jgi:hypothetical protein
MHDFASLYPLPSDNFSYIKKEPDKMTVTENIFNTLCGSMDFIIADDSIRHPTYLVLLVLVAIQLREDYTLN